MYYHEEKLERVNPAGAIQWGLVQSWWRVSNTSNWFPCRPPSPPKACVPS